MTHSIISLGQRAALSALLLRANCQPDTLPIPPIRENLGVLLRTCVRSRWLSLYAHTQRKTENAPYVSQTRTFENTSLSAACKKKQGKLWQKERGPDGASPLDRIMRCSKISAAFIAVFKNSAEQNGIFTICSLRILLRWENRIRQKDKVSAGKIRTRR